MVRFRMLLMILALAVPVAAQGQQAPYVIHPPDSNPSSPSGWTLSASLQGRTVDLGEPTWGWADDPLVKPGERSVGYSWRDNRYSLVLGFHQTGADPATVPLGAINGWRIQDPQRPGLFGFSWTYRPAR